MVLWFLFVVLLVLEVFGFVDVGVKLIKGRMVRIVGESINM